MARQKFVWREGDLVEVSTDYVPRPRAGPYIISDSISVRSQLDGREYDSKSSYYRSLKEAGMTIVGNERLTRPEPESFTERDVKEAIEQIEAGKGVMPGPAPDTWEDHD